MFGFCVRVNPALKTVFVCTPKVASTSIEECLDQLNPSMVLLGGARPGLKHSDARFTSKHMLPFLRQVYPQIYFDCFCVVRNPLEWLYSWWRYRSRPELTGKPVSTSSLFFDQFVYEYLNFIQTGHAAVPSVHLPPQNKFVLDRSSEFVVDKVFAIDHLEKLESFLSIRSGREIILPKKNVSSVKKQGKTIDLVDGNLLASVKDVLRLDFKIKC